MVIQNNIADNLAKISAQMQGTNATLVAVTKNRTDAELMALYKLGHKHFGENRVQELIRKKNMLPADAQWHLIGHLQTNKVKMVLPHAYLIHSIDSFKLLAEVNKRASELNIVANVLLQFFVASEETKFGLSESEFLNELSPEALSGFNHVDIKGIMGMASLTDDQYQISAEFDELKRLFELVKKTYVSMPNAHIEHLSMGMSSDYPIALKKGSTLIRVGSALFT